MQLVEILGNSNKIKTVDDLLNNFNCIAELAREDVYRISKAKKIYFYDFDFTYNDAVKILKNQLKKCYLNGISRFLNFNDISNAISWLITRIIANMRNTTTNKKYKLYCAPSFEQIHENIKSNDELEAMLTLVELEKFDRDTLKKGLQTIWNNSILEEDFDYFDMEYLCKKFGFEVSEIIGTQAINLQKYKKEQTESGHSQLVFAFESEVA